MTAPAPDHEICTFDAGSMYECVPICDRQAAYTVVYRDGSYGPFRAPICAQHLNAFLGRVHPGHIETIPVVQR